MDIPNIYTHINPDMDAHASCFAVKHFMPWMGNANIIYVGADWDGLSLRPIDIAVDIQAGGRGIKGIIDADGTVHSSFASLISLFASTEDAELLRHSVKFVDMQDSYGSVVRWMVRAGMIRHSTHDARRILAKTDIGSVLRAFQYVHQNNPSLVFERISEIFRGYLLMNKSSDFLHLGAKDKFGEFLFRWMSRGSLRSFDLEAIKDLVNFADMLDNTGTVINFMQTAGMVGEITDEARRLVDANSVSSVLQAIEFSVSGDPEIIFSRAYEIFDGYLEMGGAAEIRARLEANRAKLFANGKVALVKNKTEKRTDHILWERGVEAIVYDDGLNLGIVRRGEGALLRDGSRFRADHPEIRKLIESFGEKVVSFDNRNGEWYAHPTGFFCGHGSRKAPARKRSRVPGGAVVQVLSKLFR